MFPIHLLADADPDQLFPADWAILWLAVLAGNFLG